MQGWMMTMASGANADARDKNLGQSAANVYNSTNLALYDFYSTNHCLSTSVVLFNALNL